jgi:signal recognition particle receptor subunit beta
MPYVDHARKELRFKVVYYGPGLGGKTTNLEQLHARSRKDRRGKLITIEEQGERTLFFDLLPLDLGTFHDYRVRVHLCTVPGQIRFDRIRQLVLQHVDAVVMVVDSQHERLDDNLYSIEDLARNLFLQGTDPTRLPVVVQYNKRDLPNAAGIATLRKVLGISRSTPQVRAVATEGEGIFETFRMALSTCMKLVGDPAGAPAGRSPSILPGRRASMFPSAPEGSDVETVQLPAPPRVPSDVKRVA